MTSPYSVHRPRPHVSIPPDLPPRRPHPQPVATNHEIPFPSYSVQVTPPPYTESDQHPAFSATYDDAQSPSPDTARPRGHSFESSSRTVSIGRAVSAGQPTNYMPFPEPQVYRSTSYTPTPQHVRARSHSQIETPASLRIHPQPSTASFASTASPYDQNNDSDHYGSGSDEHFYDASENLSRQLSDLRRHVHADDVIHSLDSEESLRMFQAGNLIESDQAWHRLVPPEAQDALGKQEVQRQSVIFEVFKSEREYVDDLEAVDSVFVQGLRSASPPIIPPEHLNTFINKTFGNLDQIFAQHQNLLGSLFARQREQHPLVQTGTEDYVAALGNDFRPAYDTYIKHYPLSESYHRTELKRNPAYRKFVQSVASDPRIRKRDLITFLSRPVTRLPRLKLLLEQILKLTPDAEFEHPDRETLPIILSILGDFIKATQPGIEAAESKVKFWALCESLVFQRGEIIELDQYDESRTLVYSGPLTREGRSDSGWSAQTLELTGSLLDNYFILTRDDKRANGSVRRTIASRPLPLSYLRLGSFEAPAQTRKEKAEDGGLLDSFRSSTVTVYPFTIYHASSRSSRRYTFYVASDGIRKRWQSALIDAIAVHKARQEGNMWFYQRSLTDGFFRVTGPRVVNGSNVRLSGRITSAVPFMSDGRRFIAVGCQTGIYVALLGTEEYRRVFTYPNPTGMAAIQSVGQKVFDKFIVHAEGSLISYSLDLVAQVALGQPNSSTALSASMERVGKHESTIVFFKHLHIGERELIMYASKRFLQSSLDLHVVEVVHTSTLSPQRTSAPPSLRSSFRSFGESGYVPRDAFDISPLLKTVGICSKEDIVIIDPVNLTSSKHLVVPDLREASSKPHIQALKASLEDAKPLGLVPLPDNPHTKEKEILVVFDTVGCYITRQGVPCRSAGYIRWETNAAAFAERGHHIFLFSPRFIEIRNVITGLIVQVMEGADIRLIHKSPYKDKNDDILVAMRGSKDDKDGVSETIVRLTETSAIQPPTPVVANYPSAWDEWDM